MTESTNIMNADDKRKRIAHLRRTIEDCQHELARLDGVVERTKRNIVKGVGWNAPRKRWQAWITAGGRMHHLGFYDIFQDAVKAREMAEEYHRAQTV